MAIYFGKVTKYFTDRGFGFVRDALIKPSSSEIFFHIKNIKQSDAELAKKIDDDDIVEAIYFWYETGDSKKGEQVCTVLNSDVINQAYSDILPDIIDKVVSIWDEVTYKSPEWLVQITTDLMGAERTSELRAKRDKIKSDIKKENDIKRKKEEEFQKIEKNKLKALRNKRLAQQELLIETYRLQQERENTEFNQLVEEMKPLAFTHSSQVSSHIIRFKLGLKYKHISGVAIMEKDGNTWEYEGAFPRDVYAKVCSALNLENNGSHAKVVSFNSFDKLDL